MHTHETQPRPEVRTPAAAAHRRVCTCATWGLLDRYQRSQTLASFTDWASGFHAVELKMLVRGDNVAICELHSHHPGHGNARKVMVELCAWADCARVTLEVTPSIQWGSDLHRLTAFYQSLGFQRNTEPRLPLCIHEEMIRYPCRSAQ